MATEIGLAAYRGLRLRPRRRRAARTRGLIRIHRPRGADGRRKSAACARPGAVRRGNGGRRRGANARQAAGLPFYCVRAVTDLATKIWRMISIRHCVRDGHFDTIVILRAAFAPSVRPVAGVVPVARIRCARAARVTWEIFLPIADSDLSAIPDTMHAAVYRGQSVVGVEEIPTPAIGPGEILIRVEACGICHTDLKKIEHNLLAPPRIYGHETAGVVAAVGARRDRLPARRPRGGVPSHSLPRIVFIAGARLYAQCPVYKRVGITAGFEPAGGGFAQYVRVMDWIVERGVEKHPGRRLLRARHPGGAAEYLPESRGAVRSAARRTGAWSWARGRSA